MSTMKSAKQWWDTHCDNSDENGQEFWCISQEHIKAIQLDAYKSGMTEAAHQTQLRARIQDKQSITDAMDDLADDILKERDNKTVDTL